MFSISITSVFAIKFSLLLKWNVVFFRRGCITPLGGRGRFGRRGWTSARRITSAPSAAAFRTFGINKGKTFQDDLQFALFLVGFLVFPSILLQTALDQQRAAFAHVLSDDFRLAPPSF